MCQKKSKKQNSIIQLFGRKSQDICDTGMLLRQHKILISNIALCCWFNTDRCDKSAKETSLQYLRRVLKLDIKLSAWDFNSTTLAQQLTMVDKDLFLKISGIELMVLTAQQCSKNAPNVAALVAFSHRISCLVATDILSNDTERVCVSIILCYYQFILLDASPSDF